MYCNRSTHTPLNPTTDKGHENIFYVKDSETSYASRGKADSPVDVLQLVPQDHMESLQAATGQWSTAAGLHQSPSMASNFYSNTYEDESDVLGNGHGLNAGQSNFFIEWVPANCIARLASLIRDPDHISKRSNGLDESWTQVQAGLMEPPFLRDMQSTGVVGSDVSTSLFNVPRSFNPGLSTAMASPPPPPPQLYHANCRNHVQGSSCLLPPAENFYNIENFSSSQQLSVKNTLGMQNTFSNTAASMSLNSRQISTGRGGFPSTHLAPSHGDSIPTQTLGGLLPHHQRGTTHGKISGLL